MIIPLSEVLVSGFLLSLHLVLACGFVSWAFGTFVYELLIVLRLLIVKIL